MGLAATAPGLFAAIAPVAAYHRAERRKFLADALRRMPIFVVQSPNDESCSYASEEELWRELAARGNAPVLKRVDTTHLYVNVEAYSNDTQLLEFLLSQHGG